MGYSSDFQEAVRKAYLVINDKINNHPYEDGKVIMFIGLEGERDILDLDKVEELASQCIEEEEDDFQDLPYCYMEGRHEQVECKVVGISKKDDIINYHLVSRDDDSYHVIKDGYVDIRIESKADIADMI
jgi:hypothetical protein